MSAVFGRCGPDCVHFPL